jgi:hypothetical protein
MIGRMQDSHPALCFANTFKQLAEGTIEPDAWLEWWTANADAVKAACLPGWFLRLKPRGGETSPTQAALASQDGACTVLSALDVSFVRSDRYRLAWKAEFDEFGASRKAEQKRVAALYAPKIAFLSAGFPKFARFLKKHAELIDDMQDPASESELVELEKAHGILLPAVLKRFLTSTKSLQMEGVSIGLTTIFRHPMSIGQSNSGSLCIADYWLDGDGDQVLVELSESPTDDPPVFYYNHDIPQVRKLAASVTAWVESLPRFVQRQ